MARASDELELSVSDPSGRILVKFHIPADSFPTERYALQEGTRECLVGLTMKLDALETECSRRRAAIADTE